MKDETDIQKLATLSRIYISPEEQKSLKTDIDSILSYVEQIKDISADTALPMDPQEVASHRNIMREDVDPHETGLYTNELLSQAATVKDTYIEVKKIIDQDK